MPLIRSGTLSRVVLTGLVLCWLTRLLFQVFVYNPAIWRGKTFYSFMHAVFCFCWTYVTLIYGAVLRFACS